MKAAELIDLATTEGIAVSLHGDRLRLSAKREPPAAILAAFRRGKAAIIDLLRRREADEWRAFFDERAAIMEHDGGLTRREAEAGAHDHTVAQWMARHPMNTDADRCAWCGATEDEGAELIPYGSGAHHAWLHYRCYRGWSDNRRREAEAALAAMGIVRPTTTPSTPQ